MNERWYLHRDGEIDGPLGRGEVVRRIREREVDRDAFVGIEGGKWQRVVDVSAFRAAVVEATARVTAPTLIGVRTPATEARTEPVSELESIAPLEPVPARARRGATRWRLIATSTLAVVGLSLLLAWWRFGSGGADQVTVLDARFEDAPLSVRQSAVRPIAEVLTLRVRTTPGIALRVGEGPAATVDESGVIEVQVAIPASRAPIVPVDIDVRRGADDAPWQRALSTTFARPPRIRMRGSVAECNIRPCALSVQADGTLSVSGIEPTTRVTLGTAAAVGVVPDATDDILAALNPTEVLGTEDARVPLPLRFEFTDGTRVEGVYPVGVWTLRKVLFDRFASVVEGAVSVPDEERGRTILWLGGAGEGVTSSTMAIVGAAATVGQLGRVAVVEERERRRVCGRYGTSGRRRTVVVQQRDARVTVYDRRRGRVIARETVRAPRGTCPSRVSLDPAAEGDHVAAVTRPTLASIERRLRALR